MNAEICDAPAMSTAKEGPSAELADALAAPRRITLAGKEYTAKLIDFNDMVVIEQRLGNVGRLDLTSPTHQRFVLSLTLGMPEEELGKILTIKDFTDAEGTVSQLLRASGLMSEEEDAKDGNAAKKKEPARRTK